LGRGEGQRNYDWEIGYREKTLAKRTENDQSRFLREGGGSGARPWHVKESRDQSRLEQLLRRGLSRIKKQPEKMEPPNPHREKKVTWRDRAKGRKGTREDPRGEASKGKRKGKREEQEK